MSEIRSISELARALNVTRPSVRVWINHPGFPGGSLGPWRIDAVDDYLKAKRLGRYRLNGPTVGDTSVEEEGVDDLHKLRCAKMRAEVVKLELDNAERQGLLSDPTDQLHLFGLACAAINTGLMNMKARCRPKLLGLKEEIEVEEILTEEIAILINNLREWTFPE